MLNARADSRARAAGRLAAISPKGGTASETIRAGGAGGAGDVGVSDTGISAGPAATVSVSNSSSGEPTASSWPTRP